MSETDISTEAVEAEAKRLRDHGHSGTHGILPVTLALLADRDRLAAEVARLRAECDAAMAGPICDITETDMGNIVAHLSYELDPQGSLPNRNSLMMEVVHLSNRLAALQPDTAPQAREITVQEAAEVLLGHLPSEHICWAAMQDGIDDGLDAGDIMRTALRAIAAMQKGG